MAQSLSFDINIPEASKVKFDQDATFENFIGQFQPFCSKLICVIDGTYLRYYDKTGPLPTNIRFDYKQRRGSLTEYYFRDIHTNTLYCVFNREAAKSFYPRIDEIDLDLANPIIQPHKSTIPTIQSHKSTIPMFRETTRENTTGTKLETKHGKIITRVVSNQNLKHVTIVDDGVKHIFPNPNYPIEIRTFYPS